MFEFVFQTVLRWYSSHPKVHWYLQHGFGVEPIRLAKSRNISPTELRRIEIVVFEHQTLFKEKWHEFFNH
jgi:hypothetical protein